MVFKSDRQRKKVMALLRGGTKSAVSPEIIRQADVLKPRFRAQFIRDRKSGLTLKQTTKRLAERAIKKARLEREKIIEQKAKLLAQDFIIKNPDVPKEKVIKFLKSKGVKIKGNPNGIARFIGSFKEKIKQLNIPKKAGKVKKFLQGVGLEIGAVQLELERKREEKFQRRLKEVQLRTQELQLQQEEEKLRKLKTT